jgi:hypothetical protein
MDLKALKGKHGRILPIAKKGETAPTWIFREPKAKEIVRYNRLHGPVGGDDAAAVSYILNSCLLNEELDISDVPNNAQDTALKWLRDIILTAGSQQEYVDIAVTHNDFFLDWAMLLAMYTNTGVDYYMSLTPRELMKHVVAFEAVSNIGIISQTPSAKSRIHIHAQLRNAVKPPSEKMPAQLQKAYDKISKEKEAYLQRKAIKELNTDGE